MVEKIIEGVMSFRDEVFPKDRTRFEALADGQNPMALLITCSDSRIQTSLFTQTRPGELFVVRNAGNMVPPYGAGNGAEAAAIEFALIGLGVRHVIVCGHSHCGAMQALLRPEFAADMPAVRSWLRGSEEALKRAPSGAADEERAVLDRLIEGNVLLQLEHARTHPAVRSGLEGGTVALHGWVYRFETGEVLAYDPGRGVFAPLSRANLADG